MAVEDINSVLWYSGKDAQCIHGGKACGSGPGLRQELPHGAHMTGIKPKFKAGDVDVFQADEGHRDTADFRGYKAQIFRDRGLERFQNLDGLRSAEAQSGL